MKKTEPPSFHVALAISALGDCLKTLAFAMLFEPSIGNLQNALAEADLARAEITVALRKQRPIQAREIRKKRRGRR